MITINELVNAGLQEIERKYGTGHNDGEFPLAYHHRKHTEIVIEDTLKIADLAIDHHQITLRQKDLIHVAAVFHDIEQNSLEYGNELASADIMDEMVGSSPVLTSDELLEIRELILGTEVVGKHDIPMQIFAQSYLAKILADADWAALGKPTDIYIETHETLYKELFPEDTKSNRIAFFTQSLLLLKNHRFFTVEAEFLFQNQDNNLRYAKSELEKLQTS